MTDVLRIGICGYGGLGRLHAVNLHKLTDVEIVAVCDNNPAKLQPREIGTNLAEAGGKFDLRACNRHASLRRMLNKERLDAVILALPTDLHAAAAIQAMRAGVHVFCEKPMALNVRQCDRMIAARDAARRQLQVGQCLRFWHEYETLLGMIRSGPHGKLKTLVMTRVGPYSGCADPNWFNDGRRSGGAILDLHLHDVDWLQYALGPPAAICAAGAVGLTGKIDDVTALWQYDGLTATIRGSWFYQAFSMGFQAAFENALLEFDNRADPALRIKIAGRQQWEPLPPADGESGHLREMRHFIDCIRGRTVNTICTAESTRDSIRYIEIENKSIAGRKWIKGEAICKLAF